VKEPIKILIVEDIELWGDLLFNSLKSISIIQVLDVVSSQKELVNQLRKIKTDIVLLSGEIQFDRGTIVLHMIKSNFPGMKTIVMSSHPSKNLVCSYLNAGASACIYKNCKMNSLLENIIRVYQGEDCVQRSHDASNKFLQDLYNSLYAKFELTPKEVDVLYLRCEGKDIKTSASELKVSKRTVERRIENIYKKTKVKSQQDMISFGLMHGLMR
jgi:DNA-binding NarL/FixJ family response regulator